MVSAAEDQSHNSLKPGWVGEIVQGLFYQREGVKISRIVDLHLSPLFSS
jgi:hypothetical protein